MLPGRWLGITRSVGDAFTYHIVPEHEDQRRSVPIVHSVIRARTLAPEGPDKSGPTLPPRRVLLNPQEESMTLPLALQEMVDQAGLTPSPADRLSVLPPNFQLQRRVQHPRKWMTTGNWTRHYVNSLRIMNELSSSLETVSQFLGHAHRTSLILPPSLPMVMR